jgi:hypothetical protein
MDDLDLVDENERLLRDVASLRRHVEALERSRWWRLHPRFLLGRRPRPAGAATEPSTVADAFHQQIRAGSARSAAAVAGVVQDLVHARSVVDMGGGEGWWASAFADLGASAVSVDSAPLAAAAPGVTHIEHDLRRPVGREVGAPDLVLCLEVAEHLEPAVGERLVGELCALAPTVLFSAAVPGQGGLGHVNEQWPAYWVERFERHGYGCSGALRWRIWRDDRVESWYRQNLLFATAEPDRYPSLFETPLAEPWPVVHPTTLARVRAQAAQRMPSG